MNPLNLILRFLLEITALISAGVWGWKQGDDWLRLFLGVGIPVVLSAIWGVFAVRDDPSRSGSAPIPTSGVVRLIIELGFFGFAVWALSDIGWNTTALIFGAIVLVHYLFSLKRIKWLLAQ